MNISTISKRYAKALMQLSADKKDKAQKNLEQLGLVAQLFKIETTQKILENPVIDEDLKLSIIDYALDHSSEADSYVKNFIHFVVKSGRIKLLPEIIECYKNFLDDLEGKINAGVTVSLKLEDKDLISMKNILEKIFSKKVELTQKVDPTLLGGFIVSVNNLLMDLSIKTKLEQIAENTTS